MITHMHIENFKCFKDFDIDLGPFNVLIGPNDSGKTAFLQAVRIAGSMGAQSRYFLDESLGIGNPLDSVWRGESNCSIAMKFYGAERGTYAPYQHITSDNGQDFGSRLDADFPAAEADKKKVWAKTIQHDWHNKTIGRVAYYTFDPYHLKEPAKLGNSIGTRGEGFPAFLSHVLNTERSIFDRIDQEFVRKFPHYLGVATPSEPFSISLGSKLASSLPESKTPQTEKEKEFRIFLHLKPQYGKPLDARDVSDGIILSLAYLTLGCLPKPPDILLIEEPENGVHHASLKDIVSTLRQLSTEKGVQVILTTHSPYLLDQVEPDEVRAFSKDAEGAVHARKLSDLDDVEDMKKDFMTGEIWGILSEAHGI
jgi:predicted ATPase